MKALGCHLGDTRKIFLFEAACMGFVGWIAGIGLSFLFSILINKFGTGIFIEEEFLTLLDISQISTSVIPAWLVLGAIAFSVFIGVTSGLFPANKVVRISALEAIRKQ